MEAVAIDHLNLKIPPNGRDRALAFYRDTLGFDADRLEQFAAGDLPFFAVRLTDTSVIHFWPDPDFESPSGLNYDHVSIHLEASIESIRETLDDAGVPIVDDREVVGAAGTGRAVYVRDPFGYLVELKARHGE
ncbi:MAG: VOC family protein [Halodesulfurarchaeum sp.]